MTFAFYLKDKNKKEGTPLILIISHHGKKFKKSTGIIVKPEFFKKQRVKDEAVNQKLRMMEIALNERLNQFSKDEEVKSTLEYAVYLATGKERYNPQSRDRQDTPSFYAYFEEWANRDTPQKRQRRNSLKLIRDSLGDNYDWETVDTAFYFRLIQRLKDKGYSVNYIGSVVKKLKTVMSEGYKLKYHKNEDYHQFSSPMEQATTVWLTPDEVKRILDLKLTNSTEKKVQDLFTLGYYTAMRFSDYSRLSMENIKDGKIYLAQKKTAGMVVIPASPKVVAVLKRNGGEAPSLTQEAFNRTIKVLAMRAGINEKVLVVRSRGNGHIEEMVEKWSQIASHSCRRSAITALHLSGVPLHQLRLISGHKDIQSLQRYLRMTKEENAEALKSNSFFL